jgi:hypothetical protein
MFNCVKAKIHGHWFCDNCDDVVFMSYERITSTNVPCPVCGHLSCNFVPQKLNRNTIAAGWFDAMRRAVDEAVNPELPDMRHYKKRY